MTDSITITFNGKTWKMHDVEFTTYFGEYVRDSLKKGKESGRDAALNLYSFLQSYGDN